MKTVKVSIIYPVTRLTAPVVSTLIKKYNLEINILHADISVTKTGTLIADMTGEDEDIEAALRYFEEAGVGYQLVTDQIVWDEERCVHCGACTAVCPSAALTMDQTDWSLVFNREKCLVCGLCVKACPLSAMHL